MFSEVLAPIDKAAKATSFDRANRTDEVGSRAHFAITLTTRWINPILRIRKNAAQMAVGFDFCPKKCHPQPAWHLPY